VRAPEAITAVTDEVIVAMEDEPENEGWFKVPCTVIGLLFDPVPGV
jgi:hypothetical protein